MPPSRACRPTAASSNSTGGRPRARCRGRNIATASWSRPPGCRTAGACMPRTPTCCAGSNSATASRPASSSPSGASRRISAANTGGFGVVEALATLAWEGRRAAYFRNELFAALKILDEGHIRPDRMRGSWAARWASRNSCRPTSNASRSTSTGMDGGTSGRTGRMRSARSRTTSTATAGATASPGGGKSAPRRASASPARTPRRAARCATSPAWASRR